MIYPVIHRSQHQSTATFHDCIIHIPHNNKQPQHEPIDVTSYSPNQSERITGLLVRQQESKFTNVFKGPGWTVRFSKTVVFQRQTFKADHFHFPQTFKEHRNPWTGPCNQTCIHTLAPGDFKQTDIYIWVYSLRRRLGGVMYQQNHIKLEHREVGKEQVKRLTVPFTESFCCLVYPRITPKPTIPSVG